MPSYGRLQSFPREGPSLLKPFVRFGILVHFMLFNRSLDSHFYIFENVNLNLRIWDLDALIGHPIEALTGALMGAILGTIKGALAGAVAGSLIGHSASYTSSHNTNHYEFDRGLNRTPKRSPASAGAIIGTIVGARLGAFIGAQRGAVIMVIGKCASTFETCCSFQSLCLLNVSFIRNPKF